MSGQRAPTEGGIACAEVQVWRDPLSLRGSAHYRKGMGNKAGEEGGDETCKGAWVRGEAALWNARVGSPFSNYIHCRDPDSLLMKFQSPTSVREPILVRVVDVGLF